MRPPGVRIVSSLSSLLFRFLSPKNHKNGQRRPSISHLPSPDTTAALEVWALVRKRKKKSLILVVVAAEAESPVSPRLTTLLHHQQTKPILSLSLPLLSRAACFTLLSLARNKFKSSVVSCLEPCLCSLWCQCETFVLPPSKNFRPTTPESRVTRHCTSLARSVMPISHAYSPQHSRLYALWSQDVDLVGAMA